jgi:5-methylthioadenosine/S-adenosylhomocysteine deaminase
VLILPGWLITGHDNVPLRNWAIRVEGGVISEVGPAGEVRAAHPDDQVVSAADRICLPGFVNTHVHLYGVLAHGIPTQQAPADFWSFLADYWWPQVEDALDQDMIAAAARWVGAEMLRSGITTFYDILEAPSALPEALLVERDAVAPMGARAILSFEATERAGPEVARAGLAENVALIEATAGDPLAAGLICFHTTFTCSADFIREAFELGNQHGVLTHAHVNEGIHEGARNQQEHGLSTFEYYRELGVASPGFLASQCVQLTDSDRAIIAETGVKVSHMPLSNCEVGGGIAPVPELLEAGATVGLGTDGYINDFFEVARSAFLIHKANTLDPGAMPAATVLRMATEDGATALGLDRIGRLEPGWSADLQLVDAALPTPITEHNLLDQLILWRNASHVRDVMVAGSWRVRDGEVLGVDLGELRAHSHEQARRLWTA